MAQLGGAILQATVRSCLEGWTKGEGLLEKRTITVLREYHSRAKTGDLSPAYATPEPELQTPNFQAHFFDSCLKSERADSEHAPARNFQSRRLKL